jgi:hypothetical protein
MEAQKELSGNELIGNFMGFKYSIEEPDYKMRVPHFNINYNGNWIPNTMVSRRDFSEWADTYQDEKGNGYELSFDTLEFNTSWDWLMPCIKKIRSIHNEEFNINEYDEATAIIKYINPYDYDIDFVFKNVIEFIKWYNNEKS